jgi:hypothetical protein
MHGMGERYLPLCTTQWIYSRKDNLIKQTRPVTITNHFDDPAEQGRSLGRRRSSGLPCDNLGQVGHACFHFSYCFCLRAFVQKTPRCS